MENPLNKASNILTFKYAKNFNFPKNKIRFCGTTLLMYHYLVVQ